MGSEVNLIDITTSPKKHAEVTSPYVDIENQQEQVLQNQKQNQDKNQQLQNNNIQQHKSSNTDTESLTEEEVQQIRCFMRNNYRSQVQYPNGLTALSTALSMETTESVYTEFNGTTHAWTVFADDPAKRATKGDRMLGTSIILFQIFTYYVFAKEAIRDYRSSAVPVQISHRLCLAYNEAPAENFTCEAMVTDNFDNIVAFFMLGIFLSADFLQAGRTIRDTAFGTLAWCFALLAGLEVFCAFLAATIAVSYNLHIGELTDAIEVGVGLLFIRELSARAYAGLRYKKKKQYRQFFSVVFLVVLIGFILDPTYEAIFVPT